MKHMNAYVLLVLSMAALSPALTIIGGEDVRRFCQTSLSDGSLRKNVGDPNHCTLFYKCSLWFQAKLRCRHGKHFSNELQTCVDPCTAKCDTMITCPTTPFNDTITDGSGDDDNNNKLFLEQTKVISTTRCKGNCSNNAITRVILKNYNRTRFSWN